MVEILAEFLNQDPERVEDKIYFIYRVRSAYAQRKKTTKGCYCPICNQKDEGRYLM